MVTGVGDLVGADQLARHLIDAPVHRLEEMDRLEEVGDAVEGLVVDEDGAEQRLLGLDVLRSGAVGCSFCCSTSAGAGNAIRKIPSCFGSDRITSAKAVLPLPATRSHIGSTCPSTRIPPERRRG